MSKIELIDNILNPLFKENKNLLEEEQANMKIEITSGGCRYIVFKLDKKLGREYKGGIFPFFNCSNESVCTVCDYIIFAEKDNNLFALIIELKKGNNSTFPQLNAGESFVDFVVSTINRINKSSYNINKRKITIKEFKRRRKTKIQDIKYDRNHHHFFEQNKFHIQSFLS